MPGGQAASPPSGASPRYGKVLPLRSSRAFSVRSAMRRDRPIMPGLSETPASCSSRVGHPPGRERAQRLAHGR
jgi:hypothetical protein